MFMFILHIPHHPEEKGLQTPFTGKENADQTSWVM
jgi:hypothetical protein